MRARLCNIYSRRNSCVMSDGFVLCSQDLDDILFQVSGLPDYRVTLSGDGLDRLLRGIPEIARLIESGKLLLEKFNRLRALLQRIHSNELFLIYVIKGDVQCSTFLMG